MKSRPSATRDHTNPNTALGRGSRSKEPVPAAGDAAVKHEIFVTAAVYRNNFARVIGSGRPVAGSFCFF